MSWTKENNNSIWTEEKQRLWEQKKDSITAGFEQLKNSFMQAATQNPDDATRLGFYESQMSQMREELSTLIVGVKDALEDTREKVGSIDEPILALEKRLEILKKEEGNLEHKKGTRQDQMASLDSRDSQNNHTIGFFMMNSLSNPEWMIFITTLLCAFGLYLIGSKMTGYLGNLGIPMPSFSTQEIPGRIMTPLRYRMKK
jgi:chromosome segregation ATPase